jgi:hypothetical protein
VQAHGELAVALNRHLRQPVALAPPVGTLAVVAHGNVLAGGIAREDVVETQRGIAEVGVEVDVPRLCGHAQAQEHCSGDDELELHE